MLICCGSHPPTTYQMIPISNEEIKALALANGFKLKEQPDGTHELNPYVYEFARALLAHPVAQVKPDLSLPNCMCLTAQVEKFCLLRGKCSKTIAF
jgi:hypothetical protein